MNNQQTHLQRSKEAARDKLTKKYDVRYFDGSTYAVSEEFAKDLDEIVTSTYLQAAKDMIMLVDRYEHLEFASASEYLKKLQSLKQTN